MKNIFKFFFHKLIMNIELLPHLPYEIILTYLDEKSLRLYDTSLLNKERRVSYLYNLKNYISNYNVISEWRFNKGIQSRNETCYYQNLDLVSPICDRLYVISYRHKHSYKCLCKYCKRSSRIINFVNHTITYLLFDFSHATNLYLYINDINANNLRELIIVNIEGINLEIFRNLSLKCPKIEKINIFRSSSIDIVTIKKMINNNNIVINVKM